LFHRIPFENRGRIVRLLSKALSSRREVLLAVVFGGFVKDKLFRDIDVAVFTGYTIPYVEVGVYEEDLSRQLESLVKLPVDARVIDYAPPWFRLKALEGIVLVEKEYALAARLKFKARQEIEDLKAKARRA